VTDKSGRSLERTPAAVAARSLRLNPEQGLKSLQRKRRRREGPRSGSCHLALAASASARRTAGATQALKPRETKVPLQAAGPGRPSTSSVTLTHWSPQAALIRPAAPPEPATVRRASIPRGRRLQRNLRRSRPGARETETALHAIAFLADRDPAMAPTPNS